MAVFNPDALQSLNLVGLLAGLQLQFLRGILGCHFRRSPRFRFALVGDAY